MEKEQKELINKNKYMKKELLRQYPLFGSSIDPERLSLTVKGILVGIVTIIVAFGIDVSGLELNNLVDALVEVVKLTAGAISAIITTYGLVRKLLKNI